MGKFWQRDYYDIIIRDARAYLQISKYIENNPKNWKKDKFKNK
jgi:REP element-mobilizing transposase RayT